MRRFLLNRLEDATGTSGTGHVAEGVVFSDGLAVIRWSRSTNAVGVSSVVVYETVNDVEKVHGHEGRTKIDWLDEDGAI